METVSLETDIIQLEPIPDKFVKAGASTRFTCGLTSGEDVTFSWTHNGNLLVSSDRIRISHDSATDLSVLMIRKTSVSDAGSYSCIAKNLFSEARSTTALRVEGGRYTLYILH